MTRSGSTPWIVAAFASIVLFGCDSIGSDTDGSTDLPVGTWVRTDDVSEETLVFTKDGTTTLDSLDASVPLRYLGTWMGSTASGTVVWKESATSTASGKWGVPQPLLKLVTCPYAIEAGELVMTFPDGQRRFAPPDTSEL